MPEANEPVVRLVQEVKRGWQICYGGAWGTVIRIQPGPDVFSRFFQIRFEDRTIKFQYFIGKSVTVIPTPKTEEQRKYTQIGGSHLYAAASRLNARQLDAQVYVRMSSGSGTSDQWGARRVISVVPGAFLYKSEYAILKDTGLDMPELTDADWDVDKHYIGQDPGPWREILGIYVVAGSPA